jgi:hypothetical protein
MDMNKLDQFTQAYIEALFFTESGDSDDELNGLGFDDLAPEAIHTILADCASFQNDLPKDSHGRTALDLAYDYAPVAYDATQAGHDFWLTRNGHGAGFWDRGLGVVGDDLTEAATCFGECNPYKGDDGKIYV